jgi:hypothetical protein
MHIHLHPHAVAKEMDPDNESETCIHVDPESGSKCGNQRAVYQSRPGKLSIRKYCQDCFNRRRAVARNLTTVRNIAIVTAQLRARTLPARAGGRNGGTLIRDHSSGT